MAIRDATDCHRFDEFAIWNIRRSLARWKHALISTAQAAHPCFAIESDSAVPSSVFTARCHRLFPRLMASGLPRSGLRTFIIYKHVDYFADPMVSTSIIWIVGGINQQILAIHVSIAPLWIPPVRDLEGRLISTPSALPNVGGDQISFFAIKTPRPKGRLFLLRGACVEAEKGRPVGNGVNSEKPTHAYRPDRPDVQIYTTPKWKNRRQKQRAA